MKHDPWFAPEEYDAGDPITQDGSVIKGILWAAGIMVVLLFAVCWIWRKM